MIDDRELWACALAIEREHGARAPAHIAQRIGELALNGDQNGIIAWKLIAAKYDQLTTKDTMAL